VLRFPTHAILDSSDFLVTSFHLIALYPVLCRRSPNPTGYSLSPLRSAITSLGRSRGIACGHLWRTVEALAHVGRDAAGEDRELAGGVSTDDCSDLSSGCQPRWGPHFSETNGQSDRGSTQSWTGQKWKFRALRSLTAGLKVRSDGHIRPVIGSPERCETVSDYTPCARLQSSRGRREATGTSWYSGIRPAGGH